MLRHSFVVGVGLLLAAGCGSDPDETLRRDEPIAESPAGSDDVVMRSASVMMSPTQGHTVSGVLTMEQVDDGVRLTGRLTGLPPDRELGFHVHEFGDCSAPDASSAGDHFNPTNQPHGDPDGDAHHAGDMENLDVDDDGEAEVDVLLEDAILEGTADTTLRGRAVVVHAEADDYETQPSGDSGDRIACGVVGGVSVMDGMPRTPGTAGVSSDATDPAVQGPAGGR